jgi:hypothetical protein
MSTHPLEIANAGAPTQEWGLSDIGDVTSPSPRVLVLVGRGHGGAGFPIYSTGRTCVGSGASFS